MERKRAREISRQLGMSHGAARNLLVNELMYNMIKDLGKNTCFRCREMISSPDDLSIDHIEPWEGAEDARKKFFDLDNIAFSHRSCNSSYGRHEIGKRVTIKCSSCHREFSILESDYRRKKKRGQRNFYCCRRCFTSAKGYTIFTKRQVEEIRRRYAGGESTRKIAIDYNKSHVAIYRCAIGETYK